jgi:hypothetical protein
MKIDIKRYWLMIKEDPTNVWWYIQGSFRMFLWNYFPIFLRKHIEEQFLYRFKSAKQCSESGSCLFCGCSIKQGLYFANKACSLEKVQDDDIKNQLTGRTTACYPAMMSKYDWELYKLENGICK